MKCPKCGNETEMLFSDGCLSCHEQRTEMLRASLARVETGAASPPKPKPTVIPPVKKKDPKPMATEEPTERRMIRWSPEEYQQVAAVVARLFPGRPFAAKAVKEAQQCLPADRRKPSFGPNDIKKIRALIPGAKPPRPGRRAGNAIAKVSRRASAAPAPPVLFQPVTDTLPASESLADSIAHQLVSAIIGVGVSALEKAAGRLRSVSA